VCIEERLEAESGAERMMEPWRVRIEVGGRCRARHGSAGRELRGMGLAAEEAGEGVDGGWRKSQIDCAWVQPSRRLLGASLGESDMRTGVAVGMEVSKSDIGWVSR
jgi:hypothetical protein